MALSSGTEVYSIQKNGCLVYDNIVFPTSLSPIKTYYGDKSGASDVPKDKYWYSGELVGITLGETKTLSGKLYYKVEVNTDFRQQSGFLGLGAGIYQQIKYTGWVLSSDITDSKTNADDLLDNRVNADKVAKAKADQALVDALKDSGSDSGDSGSGGINVTKVLAIALGFVVIVVFAVFSFKKKQNKNDGLAGNKKEKMSNT